MDNSFQVSVVIPMFNAERFIKRAIQSALDQDEVREVIVVDDGFKDKAYDIVATIAKNDERVKLFHHEDHKNLGAGATRNLGIVSSKCEYVAFLDADDFYLPDRFKRTKTIFKNDPKVSAVYEAVGTEFDDRNSLANFAELKQISEEDAAGYLSFPVKPLEGKELFDGLLLGTSGSMHTNGVTVKRKILEVSGLFQIDLPLHQDTELWIRIAYFGYFSPGIANKAVATRVIHQENRITRRNFKTNLLLRRVLFLKWYNHKDVMLEARQILLKRYIQALTSSWFNSDGIHVKVLWRIVYILFRSFYSLNKKAHSK